MKRSIQMFALLMGMLLISFVVPTLAQAANPLSWTVTRIEEGDGNLPAVSCPSTSLCVAVVNIGNVVTSTNPTGGAGAWNVAHVDSSGYLDALSCPSASLCVAGDFNGNIVTSTNPTGGASAWTVTNISPGVRINAISCPTASMCVAVGSAGDIVTSTNPTGGASAWTLAHIDGENTINGISCQSASLCVAVDSAGNVVTSTNPTGGASAWHIANVSGIKEFANISCPSTTLCVAVNGSGEIGEGGGYIVTSTNPTGGAGMWTATHVDSSEYIYGISCPSTALCVAGDLNGNILTSNNPTGGAGAWTFTHVEEARLLGISCPSTTLCVAGDYGNDILVGTPAVVPVNSILPVVSGTPQVGQTLSCSPGSWSGSMPQTYTYQWQREGTDIGGATGTYVVEAADQGHTLTCVVTATNSAGPSSPATSAPTGVVQAAPGSGGTPPPPPPVVVQCHVPKLKGKTLSKAKKVLVRAHCKLGKVSSSKTHRTHKVVSQKPGAGKTLPAGAKIAVKLG